jgi:RNA polymerase sigma-70 factor (ECF subfamily)
LRSESPDKNAEDQAEREMLLNAIRRLPEERQQLLMLKFVDQLSNAEIGDIMERTEGAIKSLYHRTLIALRDDILMQQNPLASAVNTPSIANAPHNDSAVESEGFNKTRRSL